YGIAIALGILLFVARSPFYFGVAYSLYSAINLASVGHLGVEMCKALNASQDRLTKEGTDVPKNARIYAKALELLRKYYLSKYHILRLLLILIIAITGLVVGSYGRCYQSQRADTLAYALFIFDVVVLEGVYISIWRER